MNQELIDKIEGLKNSILANGLGKSSLRKHLENIKGFVLAKNIQSVDQITTPIVTEYFAGLRSTVGTSTINGKIASLKKFFDLYDINVKLPKAKMAKTARIKQPITQDELKDLIEPNISFLFPDNALQVKSILYFMFFTGLRKNEVISIKRKDFYWEKKSVLVWQSKQQSHKKVRLNINLVRLLEKYFGCEAEEDNAFNTSEDKIDRIFTKLEANEVLGKGRVIHPHLFRDSFACLCLSKGCSLPEVKELMGHANIAQTMQYITLVDNDLDKTFANKIKGIQ